MVKDGALSTSRTRCTPRWRSPPSPGTPSLRTSGAAHARPALRRAAVHSTGVRLFLAGVVPGRASRRACTRSSSRCGWRPHRPGGSCPRRLHLTLVFLGSVPDAGGARAPRGPRPGVQPSPITVLELCPAWRPSDRLARQGCSPSPSPARWRGCRRWSATRARRRACWCRSSRTGRSVLTSRWPGPARTHGDLAARAVPDGAGARRSRAAFVLREVVAVPERDPGPAGAVHTALERWTLDA